MHKGDRGRPTRKNEIVVSERKRERRASEQGLEMRWSG